MYEVDQYRRLVLGQRLDSLSKDADERSKTHFIASNTKFHHERQIHCQHRAEHGSYRVCRLEETSDHLLFHGVRRDHSDVALSQP